MGSKKSDELTKTYFDSTAGDYDNSFDGKFVRSMYQEILNRVKVIPGDSILDLGCGNGNVIALLQSNLTASVRYYGLDISANMIEEAKRRLGEQVSLQVGDVLHLPYEDQKFDLIICNASFHHYLNPQKAVNEMKRVLKKDGIIILGDPTLRGKLLVLILNWFMKFSRSGDAKIWHKQEIIGLFTNNGFQVENWQYINHQTFMFNAILKETERTSLLSNSK